MWPPIRVSLLLCSLGLLPTGAQPTTAQELYVKPTEDTPCLHQPCHTLDEYVENSTQYFASDTTFNFLHGTHTLSQLLKVAAVANLAMTAAANATVNVTCRNGSNLTFSEVYNLSLENLLFSSCGYVTLINVDGSSALTGLTLPGLPYGLDINFSEPATEAFLRSDKHLTLQDVGVGFVVSFSQSSYAAAINIVNATIVDSVVIVNIGSEAACNIGITHSHFYGDLVIIEIITDDVSPSSSVYIDQCEFGCGSDSSILFLSCPGTLENSKFFCHSSNRLYDLQALAIDSSHFIVRNVTIYDLRVSEFTSPNSTEEFLPIVSIEDSNFVTFVNCTFLYNELTYTYRPFIVGSIVFVENCTNLTFSDCEFIGNKGTPILASDSTFVFTNRNVFENNIAYQGGALALYGTSHVYFTNGSTTVFHNNSADDVGGAVYIQGEGNIPIPTYFPCFFQLSVDATCVSRHVHFLFTNNTATRGGNAIFGATLDVCTVGDWRCGGWKFINTTLHLSPNNGSDFSVISSNPLRACLCEGGRPSCTTVVHSVSHFPGEEFNVSAVVVGDRFGTVNGSVYARVLPFNITGQPAALEETQYSQEVGYDRCTNLSYTVYYNSNPVCIALTSEVAKMQECPTAEVISNFILPSVHYYNSTGTINSMVATLPVLINVTLRPCPLGFTLSRHPPRCVCDTQLQEYNITCDLATQTIQRKGTFWVSPSFHGNISDGVILSEYCPNNYCISETMDVNLTHPDTQCAFKHSGILCGGCQSGLSLALGSPQCLHCSNDYLALLIPFALAGIALVLFLKILNLTVADGILNGIVFCANIVRANQSLWLPNSTNIPTVFIAWLNLDLGIETCFVDGLDAYWKTWLQLVFPFYIWTIVILIIILCHYSTVATKIFGSNSVPVLATLFLLSYAKLLRTVISILQPSILHYPHGETATVWSYDGNIAYLSRKHIPLVVVAIALLLFLWLPYTGILFFAQCLQRSKNYKVNRLLAMFKPFLDAYFGPLKPKHRYWIGLLLLVRGVLFVVYAATPTDESTVDLLATGIAILCLLVYPYAGWVYRSTYLNILESSFLLNLGILSLGSLYINASGGSQAALVYTSVWICFAQFTVMVAFNVFKLVGGSKRCARLYYSRICRPPQRKAPNEDINLLKDSKTDGSGVSRFSVSVSGYREPVLQYQDL